MADGRDNSTGQPRQGPALSRSAASPDNAAYYLVLRDRFGDPRGFSPEGDRLCRRRDL